MSIALCLKKHLISPSRLARSLAGEDARIDTNLRRLTSAGYLLSSCVTHAYIFVSSVIIQLAASRMLNNKEREKKRQDRFIIDVVVVVDELQYPPTYRRSLDERCTDGELN